MKEAYSEVGVSCLRRKRNVDELLRQWEAVARSLGQRLSVELYAELGK